MIIKRTFAIEKRLMGDVESLKKKVSELEGQKKKLQFDSVRLQQALNEISSKQEKVCWHFCSLIFLITVIELLTLSCTLYVKG